MADEGERVGGIYIDVGVDDADVLDRLNALEATMSRIGKQAIEVKVNYVEQGSTTPKRAKNQKVEVPATVALEKDAAKKAAKGVNPVTVPVKLALANDAISKLKAQITEAFQNFSIKVNVEYGTGVGGFQASTAQEEFEEQTGLARGSRHPGRRVVRSTGPAAEPAPAFDRFYAVAKNSQILDELKKAFATLKQTSGTPQGTLNRYQAAINQAERRINVLSNTPAGRLPEEREGQPVERPLAERERAPRKRDVRRAKRVTPVAAAVVREETPTPEPVPDGHDRYVWPTTRAAERPATPPREAVVVPLPTSTRTGRAAAREQQGMLYPLAERVPERSLEIRAHQAGREPLQYATPTLNIIPSEREFYERQEADQQRMARTEAEIAGKGVNATGSTRYGPRVGPAREFDRTPQTTVAGARGIVDVGPAAAVEGVRADENIVIRGPIQRRRLGGYRTAYPTRRKGPTRTVAPGPEPGRRFLEPFAPNRVTEEVEAGAIGTQYKPAYDLLERYRRGEFGTREEPLVSEIGEEGRLGPAKPLTDKLRRQANRRGEAIKPNAVIGQGKYKVRRPEDLFKEAFEQLGNVPDIVRRRIFGDPDAGTAAGIAVGRRPAEIAGLLRDPRFRPGAGMGFGGGGYVGTSTGAGGAARSALDTPEGNRESRARIQASLYQDAFERVRAVNPDLAAAISAQKSQKSRRAMLEPYLEQTGGDIVEERALRKMQPEQFGYQPRLAAALERYRGGYDKRAGLAGYLPEDREATPKSVYNAYVAKILDQYKEKYELRKSTKLAGLPSAIQEQVSAGAAVVRGDTGHMEVDYDKISATGGAGRRFVPGAIEEAANRYDPANKATTKARERRRDYTPAEQQLAETRARLEVLEGTPETLRTAVKRGTATEVAGELVHEPGRPGTAEEQRQSRQGGATKVTRARLGEIDVSQLLLREVQARAARKTKEADEIRAVLTGQKSEDNPEKARALIERFRGYGLNIPEGGSLPAGPLNGIDISPAKNVTQAKRRLATARREQRGYRRMLPATYAAADAERRADQERIEAGYAEREAAGLPVDRGTGPIITDTSPITGDKLRAKLAANPTIGRAIPLEEAPKKAKAAAPAAPPVEPPVPEEPIPVYNPQTGSAVPENVIPLKKRRRPEKAAAMAAEDREPPLGPPTTIGGGGIGGIVRVFVTNFNELKGILKIEGGKPGKAGPAKASEEKEPEVPKEAKPNPFVTRARQRTQLLNTLRSQGLPIEEARPEGRPFTGKSPQRIQAEAEILEARSLSPTRAFQTAIAAAFAKTIGGGGAFEQRVKGLQGALSRRADIAEEVGDTARELAAVRKNLGNVATVADNLAAAGKTVPASLQQYEESLQADRKALIERAVAQRGQRAEATEDVARRRQGLISPLGVVRGFGALGAGAIAGGLIFGAASQGIQAALGLLEKGGEQAADALSGFAITATRVSEELAQGVRAAAGDVRGGVSQAAIRSGISQPALETLGRQGLFGRAEGQAAAQGRVETSDLFRTANATGASRFDKSLFEGTGGILNSPLFAPQPGFLERVIDDITSFKEVPKSNYAPLKPAATGANPLADFVNNAILDAEKERRPDTYGPQVVDLEKAKLFNTYISDFNTNLDKANSNFKLFNGATTEQKNAMIASAKSIGREQEARDLASKGLAFTTKQGGNISGGDFGLAVQQAAEGQNLLDPRLQFESDKRSIEAQIRSNERDFRRELDVRIPQETSLAALAAPLPQAGATLSAANPQEQKAITAQTQATLQLQNQLDASYEKGNNLLKEALPKELYDRIQTTGAAIAKIQTDIAAANSKLQAHEYANQLRIAERSLNDIAALTGKTVKGQYDGLGYIEKQNVALSRQSEILNQQLAQRQINFQVALAGFVTPGEGPEERAARIKDAKAQAEFAQKQLDIQKKLFGNEIKIFDIQNAREFQDITKSIGLLTEGRKVALDTADAEEKLVRLQKQQDRNVKEAGAYLSKIEKNVAVAESELQKLESAYGKAIVGITEDTIKGFVRWLSQMNSAIAGTYTDHGTVNNLGSDRRGYPTQHASGVLGDTSGPTSMIVGEAGTETVAVLRNPRKVTSGGGSSNVTININNPSVREDSDLQKIVQQVTDVLNRRTAMLGLR